MRSKFSGIVHGVPAAIFGMSGQSHAFIDVLCINNISVMLKNCKNLINHPQQYIEPLLMSGLT